MKRLKQIFPILLTSVSLSVLADNGYPPVNQVTYQLSAEQWATTQTARVVISIDASLDKNGLAQARQQIMQNLAQLSKTNWQITVFNRNQDQSGLETVHVEAQARLPETALNSLRDNAKSVSRPGQTYRVMSIDFVPTTAEMEATRTALRANIYVQAKSELAELNKMYPDQHYFLHSIDFTGPIITPTPLQRNMLVAVNAAPTPPLTVNDKVQLSATVVLASQMPKQ